MSANQDSIDAGAALYAARRSFPHAVDVTAIFSVRMEMAKWMQSLDIQHVWEINCQTHTQVMVPSGAVTGRFRFRQARYASLFVLKWSPYVAVYQ